MLDLKKIIGFEWDKWNVDKSYIKHGITPKEAEELFLDENVLFVEDIKHWQKEDRFIAIGKTSQNKILFSVFTVRSNKIRIISVRRAKKKKGGNMQKKLRSIPHFTSEKEERKFWQTHDSTEYVDYSKAKRVRFPNLKLSSKPITIRLPEIIIERLKIKAHKMDIPYQALIKKLIFEGMAK